MLRRLLTFTREPPLPCRLRCGEPLAVLHTSDLKRDVRMKHDCSFAIPMGWNGIPATGAFADLTRTIPLRTSVRHRAFGQ
jgi:hypothetical protein